MSWILRKIDERKVAKALKMRSRMTEWQMTLTICGRRDFHNWRVPHNDLKRMEGCA